MDNKEENKNKDNVVAKTIRAIQAAKKIKMIFALISAAAPVLGWILLGCLIILLLLIPMFYLSEILEAASTGYDKFLNFVTGEGFVTSENVFFGTLEEEYSRYVSISGHEGEFDAPILASTIHYGRFVDPNVYTLEKDEDENIKQEEYRYDRSSPIITPKQIRSFYVVANNKLGSAYTLWPGQAKLIGHLIDTRFVIECANKPQGWDIFSPNAWNDILGSANNLLNDLASHLIYTTEDTTKDILSQGNILKLTQLIIAYKNQGQDYFISEFENYKHEAIYDNLFSNIIRIAGHSSLVNTCADDQLGIPALRKFIHYDYYKEYLLETFLEDEPYNTCDTCPYNLASSDAEKKRILEMQITEIFDQRDAYDYLYGTMRIGQGVYYIPGMSSLPFKLSGGENWDARLTSPFGWRIHPKKPGERNFHRGLDFGYRTGTPIFAVADGLVMESKMSPSYGNYVKLSHDLDGDHKPEYYSLYAHLSVRNVVTGQMIGGGQKIGEVGNTGVSTGSHLHFEIMDEKGNVIDPAPILEGIMQGNSVLDKPFTTKYYRQSLYSIYEYCPGMKLNSNQPATIYTSGALPTSYAMVISKLTADNERDPVYVANYICENTTYRLEGSGTDSAFYTDPNVKEHFKISANFLTKENVTFDKIDSALSNGQPIIVNVNKGTFDPNGKGHYVVLDNITAEKEVVIYDPASMAKSGTYSKKDVEDLLISSIDKGIWYFERRN